MNDRVTIRNVIISNSIAISITSINDLSVISAIIIIDNIIINDTSIPNIDI